MNDDMVMDENFYCFLAGNAYTDRFHWIFPELWLSKMEVTPLQKTLILLPKKESTSTSQDQKYWKSETEGVDVAPDIPVLKLKLASRWTGHVCTTQA